MGGYFSSKRGKGEGEDDSDPKRRKMNGRDMGILKSKEYQIVYGADPVAIHDLPAHVRSMFLLKRTGSMFFDEDGDLAHEFYVEEKRQNRSKVRWTMRRVFRKLIPEGDVVLPVPRLRNSIPIVLLDSNAIIVPR